MTGRAFPPIFTGVGHRPSFSSPAVVTAKPFRPAKPEQMLLTGRLAREAGLQFQQISRIILHGQKLYRSWSPASSKYPSREYCGSDRRQSVRSYVQLRRRREFRLHLRRRGEGLFTSFPGLDPRSSFRTGLRGIHAPRSYLNHTEHMDDNLEQVAAGLVNRDAEPYAGIRSRVSMQEVSTVPRR